MWARLQEGEHPLLDILSASITGATVTEMILQSHTHYIRLLPALPKEWPTGSVSALRARQGIKVDLVWKHSDLESAAIRLDLSRKFHVRTKKPLQITSRQGTLIEPVWEELDLMVFRTEEGQEYTLTPQS